MLELYEVSVSEAGFVFQRFMSFDDVINFWSSGNEVTSASAALAASRSLSLSHINRFHSVRHLQSGIDSCCSLPHM